MTLKAVIELLQQKRFLEELEYGIRFTDREIINKIIPVLNKNTIFELAFPSRVCVVYILTRLLRSRSTNTVNYRKRPTLGN